MEGGGEGMVAVVQGLQDAGLAVTLMDGRRALPNLPSLIHQERATRQVQHVFIKERSLSPVNAGVDTSTLQAKYDSGAQVTSDKYSSSYMVAHSSSRPPSPPPRTPDVLPPRFEPRRTPGNFDVSYHATNTEFQTPVRDKAYHRSTHLWPEIRGSQVNTRSYDLFVESLRKYPSPSDLTSADMITKLINYTQAKSQNNTGKPFRFKAHVQFAKDRNVFLKAEKDVNVKNINNDKKVRSPLPSHSRHVRYKDNHINETFDYLKSTTPTIFARSPEIRYLEDVTKCIKNTIRQIVSDQPVVCPRIQRRYAEHQRLHRVNSEQQTVCQPTCPSLTTTCCACGKPLPCTCSSLKGSGTYEDKLNNVWHDKIFEWLREIPVYANISLEDKQKRVDAVKQLANTLIDMHNDDDFDKKGREAIIDCLNNLPMWKPSTKDQQDSFYKQMTDILMDKLVKSAEDLKSDVKVTFKDEEGKIITNDHMGDLIIDRLKPFPIEFTPEYKNNLRDEINEVLEELSVEIDGDKEGFIGHLMDKITKGSEKKIKVNGDYLQEIKDWFEDIPELFEDIDDEESGQLVYGLARKLQEIQCSEMDEETIHENMMNETQNWIESTMENKNRYLSPKTRKDLSEKLMKRLISDKFANINKLSGADDDEINHYTKEIKEWFDGIPELADGGTDDAIDTEERINNLANKVQEIKNKADDSEEEELQKEIENFIELAMEKKNRYLSPKTRKDLTDKLYERLTRPRELFGGKVSVDDNINKDYFKEVEEWLENIPQLVGSKAENQKKIKPLAAKLINLISEGEDEEKLRNEITKFLVTEAENKDTKLDGDTVNNLADELINKLNKLPAPKREPINPQLTKQIWEWVRDVIPDIEETPLVYEMIEKLARKTMIEGLTDEEMQNEIINWLDELGESTGIVIDPIKKELFAKKLVPKVKSIPKPRKRWSKQEKQQPIIGDESFDDIKPHLEEEIGFILDDYQIRDREKIEAPLIDTLCDHINNNKSDGDTKDSILKILQDKATGKDAEELGDKLMSLVHEVSLIPKNKISTMKTSTPHRGKDGYSFQPKRFNDTSISAIYDDYFTEPNEVEEHYVSDLVDAIKTWKDDLNIKLSDNGQLEDAIIKELAKDISEKQKYIQIHSNVKPTAEEELEDLKYQVFRSLNKTLDDATLATVMDKTDVLLNKIKKLPVPQLTRTKSAMDGSKWDQKQDSHEFIEENFKGGILDFLKDLPMYKDSNDADKRLLEKRCADMAKNLQTILTSDESGADFDTLMLNEIKNQIKKFPLTPEQKSDESFMNDLALKFLDYIKNMQLFQDLSQRLPIQSYKGRPTIGTDLVSDVIQNWFKDISIEKGRKRSSDVARSVNDFVKKMCDMLSNVDAVSLDTHKSQMEEETKKFLKKVPIDMNKTKETDIQDHVDRLFDEIKEKTMTMPGYSQVTQVNSLKPTDVANIVQDWFKDVNIEKGRRRSSDIARNVNDFAKKISDTLSSVDAGSIDILRPKLQEETKKFLKQVPVDMNKETDGDIQGHVDRLFNKINEKAKALPQYQAGSSKPGAYETDSSISSKAYKPAEILNDKIENWCEALPIKGNVPEEVIKAEKQNMANKIKNMVTDLNMSPEIFNDDFIYNEMLQDEVDNILSSLPSNLELANVEDLKKTLIDDIIDAKQKIHDDLAGQVYKQQLRDAVSNTLSPIDVTLAEDQASFEVLKDAVADAFISLNYVAGDNEEKAKYKKKIAAEIEKFSNNYLQHNPDATIDTKQVNEDLFNALKKVPIPKDETLKSEIEQLQIKDEINDWIKELPLTEETPTDALQRAKKVGLLAKRLHDIEKEKEHNNEIDVDDKMKKEISKWMKKLPLRPSFGDIEPMAEKLVENLKKSAKSRSAAVSPLSGGQRASVSSLSGGRRASSGRRMSATSPDICPYYRNQPTQVDICDSSCMFPPSTLNQEDRDLLDRVRERSLSGSRFNIRRNSRDASVNPRPMDASNQTDNPDDFKMSCGLSPCVKPPCLQDIQIQCPPRPCNACQLSSLPPIIVRPYPIQCRPQNGLNTSCFASQTGLSKQIPRSLSPRLQKQVSIDQKPCQSPSCPKNLQQSSIDPTNPDCMTNPQSPCPSRVSNPAPGPMASNLSMEREIPITSTPKRPINLTDSFRQPHFTQDYSDSVDTDSPEVGTSTSLRERMANLGSSEGFEDHGRKRDFHNDHFPNKFWGTPCCRRKVYRIPRYEDLGGNFIREREKTEEKVKCKCKERVVCKNRPRRTCPSYHSDCNSSDNLWRCSKCCGMHCPHPSKFYFS